MSKLIRLSKTGIEYADYSWNFASGCGNNIGGKCKAGGFTCWAYSIVERFPEHYPDGFNPHIYPEALLSPLYLKKPSLILCAFMGDLFLECEEFRPERMVSVPMISGLSQAEPLKERIYRTISQTPHTYLFLTKQPQNLIKWSPFPPNCYVGVTATNRESFQLAMCYLVNVQAKIRFISFEPLLQRIILEEFGEWGKEPVDWLIIGACTGRKAEMSELVRKYPGMTLMPYGKIWTAQPNRLWVSEIIEACNRASIPYFLKDNLRPLLGDNLIQNMPKGVELDH